MKSRIIISALGAACLACGGSSFMSVDDAGDDGAQGLDGQGEADSRDDGAPPDDGAGHADGAGGDALDAAPSEDGGYDPHAWCCGPSVECGEGGLQWVCAADGGTVITYCLSLTSKCQGSCVYFDPKADADLSGNAHPCS
jgi:hypothetical protein